jgi:hypothetical protein
VNGIIRLMDTQRKTVLHHLRFGSSAQVSRHTQNLLLLDRGWSYRKIMDSMFCDSDLIVDVKRRFLSKTLESALGIEKESVAEPE